MTKLQNCHKAIYCLHINFTQFFPLFCYYHAMRENNDVVEINGVELSPAVLEAMRVHDFNPKAHPAGYLREIVSEIINGIRDPEGSDLLDKLKLTYDEIMEDRNKQEKKKPKRHMQSWVERCCPEGHKCDEEQSQEHGEKIKEERKNKWGYHPITAC